MYLDIFTFFFWNFFIYEIKFKQSSLNDCQKIFPIIFLSRIAVLKSILYLLKTVKRLKKKKNNNIYFIENQLPIIVCTLYK